MNQKKYPLDGRKHWWLPAALCFGPALMAFIPRIVDHDLLQYLLVLTGVSMQAGVNLYLYRMVRQNEYSAAHRAGEPVDATAKP